MTKLAVAFLFAGLGGCLLPSAAAEESGVIFSCDFESDAWWEEWGAESRDRHATTVEQDAILQFVPHRGRALRISVDQGGHYGLSLAYQFKKRMGHEPEEIYFRYYLRLADDWDPRNGGKLPGIGGTYGRAGWGGRKVDGTDGWSARGLFLGQQAARTQIGFYCYHADMKGTYGDNWLWKDNGFPGLENNRWYCIEQHARMNTAGANDGVLRAWVDGVNVFDKSDVRMRDVDSLKIEMIWLNLYHGGKWTAETPDHLYIDDVVISRMPIGKAMPK